MLSLGAGVHLLPLPSRPQLQLRRFTPAIGHDGSGQQRQPFADSTKSASRFPFFSLLLIEKNEHQFKLQAAALGGASRWRSGSAECWRRPTPLLVSRRDAKSLESSRIDNNPARSQGSGVCFCVQCFVLLPLTQRRRVMLTKWSNTGTEVLVSDLLGIARELRSRLDESYFAREVYRHRKLLNEAEDVLAKLCLEAIQASDKYEEEWSKLDRQH